jgi:3-methyl-2-oxobutanoate hydroxymethyltransferase
MSATKITVETLKAMKARGEKIAALTAYDYPMAKLLDEAGIPMLLVGDSVGMVVLGYPDTTHVTMAEIEHHTRAASRAKPDALLGADLPFQSYETVETAVTNARRLIAAGADYVKAEGGREILPQVKAIIAEGISFCGHLGMLPQHVLEEGGYHLKGKKDDERQKLVDDAVALADAGAFAIVLELVAAPVSLEITRLIPVPTIGIGSGAATDGQILVISDLIGAFPWFTPRFVKPRIHTGADIKTTVGEWQRSLHVS